MAAGIDWLRWHHGTVSDPKFQLVAKRAQTTVANVLAVWATALEAASQAASRGEVGELDCEAIDCGLGLEEGTTDQILNAMYDRKLIAAGRLVAWEKRQPKREREGHNSSERVAKHRATKRHVTPSNARHDQETPRGEESREDASSPSSIHPGGDAAADSVGHFEGQAEPQPGLNPVAPFAVALNRAGFSCTSLNPDLVAYAEAGGTVDHLLQVAGLPECAGKKATYPIRIARRELAEKAAPVAAGQGKAQPAHNPSGVSPVITGEEAARRKADALEAMNRQLGELGYASH